MTMRRRCQWCHETLYREKGDGTLLALKTIVISRENRPYCVPCHEKLRRLALDQAGVR